MNRIKEVTYNINTALDKKIIIISDIHYYDKKMIPVLKALLNRIKDIKPDYICVPGDIIDENVVYDLEYLYEFFDSLALIAPVVLSYGNHEISRKRSKEEKLNEDFDKNIHNIDNIHFLKNTTWEDEDICFGGLYLSRKGYIENKKSYCYTNEALDECYKGGINSKYQILLSHTPYPFFSKVVKDNFYYQDIDLILSGHTHGGITPKWLFKLTKRVLISPNKKFFVKNSYGYYPEDKVLISSGIVKLSHVNSFRIFNKLCSSEIVIINLKKD